MSGTPADADDARLAPHCPRCLTALEDAAPVCPTHGAVPVWWRSALPSYDGLTAHLRTVAPLPTYLPWPLGSLWSITGFGAVRAADGTVLASVAACAGPTPTDGPVEVVVLTEEPGTGLGAAYSRRAEPAPEDLAGRQPTAKVAVEPSAAAGSVRLWLLDDDGRDAAHHAGAPGEWDASTLVGEADGRWLWVVLRPAAAVLMLQSGWALRDLSTAGAHLLDVPFGGQTPPW